jgi:hypothetical protein
MAAETALVRVVHHYGERPEFVLMGGLMPDYLCSSSVYQHAGTTDVDVQVDLEIARRIEINVTGLAGFLLAKTAAARDRQKPKDWYDIAFVLLHNDAGGPEEAAQVVLGRFGDDIQGGTRTALLELGANFTDRASQGPRAYVEQMMIDHPDLDPATVAGDSILAVKTFCRIVTGG